MAAQEVTTFVLAAVRACVRAAMRASVCAAVRASVRAFIMLFSNMLYKSKGSWDSSFGSNKRMDNGNEGKIGDHSLKSIA